MKNNELFKIVQEQLDKKDPCGLLTMHCPADEYSSEAVLITDKLHKGMSTEQIAAVMAEVLNAQFEEIFNFKKFMVAAAEIKKFLDR